MLLDERDRRRAGADVDVTLPAHLSTSALVRPRRGRRAVHPRPAPPDADPARHRPPGAARRSTPGSRSTTRGRPSSTSTSCPGRPTTTPATPTWAPCERPSWPASGPTARRSRSRPASRPWSTASPCAAGSTRCSRRSRPTGSRAGSSSTGRPEHPPTGARAAARACSSSAYRLAWARLRGVPEHRVRGAFFHAATGETLWPELPGADEITAVLAAARP